MSFDARSKERLEALGRTLPKKLPLPEPAPNPRASSAPQGAASSPSAPIGSRPQKPRSPGKKAEGQGVQSATDNRLPRETTRHRLEREQDPAELFRALITASPDGTVPPHLLDRLRDLESPRQPAAALATSQPPATAAATRARTTPKGSASAGKRGGRRAPAQGRPSEDQDLYTAFAQLLLEDDGD
jgi:hypothetical protein